MQLHEIKATISHNLTVQDLDTLEETPRGKARLKQLENLLQHLDIGPGLRQYLFLALSPDVTFGVKALPEVSPGIGVFDKFIDDQNWMAELVILALDLASRELSGNAARDEIEAHLNACTASQRVWSRRLLEKDLRLQIGAKAVNKISPGLIPLFEVPLAEDLQKVKNPFKEGRWCVQPKLDGARTVAIVPADPKKPVQLLSRTGKLWQNFESVRLVLEERRHLLQYVSVMSAGEDLYLDGEVVSLIDGRIDFQALQQTMMRDDGQEIGKLRFCMFDCASKSEWYEPRLSYEDRRLSLISIHLAVADSAGRLTLVPSTDMRSVSQFPALQKVERESALEFGYEGLMWRRLDLPPVPDRSKLLLKDKEFFDTEAVITGTVEGRGRMVGMLGALQCQTSGGQAFEIGSGYTDAQRQDLWKRRDTLPGQQVTYKYFELTDAQIPRFPIFKALRTQE